MKTKLLLQPPAARFVAQSSLLSLQQIMHAIPVEDVLRVLNKLGANYVLAGAHGIAEWRKEARATMDVDVIVMARYHRKAVKALDDAFQLEKDEQEVVTRLRHRETKEVAVDVMKTNQPLFKAAFKNTAVYAVKKVKCKIPSLEMALALKFAPMISLMRADYKKYMDAADFIRIVNVNPDINLEKLAALGDLVYPGGGKEIVE